MLNHTRNIQNTVKFCFLFLAPYARTTRYEEVFLFLGKPRKKRLASFARLMTILNPKYLPIKEPVDILNPVYLIVKESVDILAILY